MLSTPLVGLAGEGFYHCSAGVYLAQEVGNLLLSSGVVGKHIAEKPAFSTPMLNLRG